MDVDGKGPGEVIGLLDLGSNAARFILARIRPGRGFAILEEDRVQTRLASGARGSLPARAVRDTLRATGAFLETARREGAGRIIGLATAAVRDAGNSGLLLGPLRARHGLDLRILSEAEEGHLGARAALTTLPLGTGVVVDLGGGSLQITRLLRGEVLGTASLPLGVVRATMRFLRHDPPTGAEVRALRRGADALLAGVLPPAAEGGTLIGMGGTVRALARIQRAADGGDGKIHGARLSRAAVGAIRERLEALPPRRRRAVKGLKAERADIIVAGALIVEELMEFGGYERLVVCAYGVRHGVLIEETFGRRTPA